MTKHSAACCTIPPVVAGDYEIKGKYTTVGGMKSCAGYSIPKDKIEVNRKSDVTGSSTADTGILLFYDIFGYTPQILQGADILAYTDKEHSVQLFMPDWWYGEPADFSWYPPDTPEKEASLNKWLERAAPPTHIPQIAGILEDAEKHNPNIKSWGMIGYCWGGKMVSLVAGQDFKFKAAVQTSPSMIDPAEAPKVKIPMCMLASEDEPVDDVKKYEAGLTVPKHFETFDGHPHGFMSARAEFNDPDSKDAYVRGYKSALKFFQAHL